MARAIVFNGQKLELVTKEVPEPTPGHVVVRITIRPLFRTDLYFGHQVIKAVEKPIVLGYKGFRIIHSIILLTLFA